MKKVDEIDVRGTLVRILKIDGHDFVCITDIAHLKSDDPAATISNWMRNRMTLEYLGLWEELYNPTFNPLGFEGFRKDAGLNSFTMSPTINAVMINDGIPQPQRLKRLNEIAIHQMRVLSEVDNRKLLK